ncbi:hypothetical protein [Streptococcus halichoeri]|uniref:hypothetical protein n=1 Tax=Streptococcus halichoeri TaxID=254785 RepID=UPI0013580753|nr:hypothetical protein [Streptococcus halichoeri]
MSKKFLQSLTILGLLSTALGVAQPVGAVVSGKYQSELTKVSQELESLKDGGNIPVHALSQIAITLQTLLEQVNYVLSREDFRDLRYEKALKELDMGVAGYEIYLSRLPKDLQDLQRVLDKETYDDIKELSPEIRQVVNLTKKQYNFILSKLKNCFKKFQDSVGNIEYNYPELYSYAYYLNPSDYVYPNNPRKVLAHTFIERGYYENLYDKVSNGEFDRRGFDLYENLVIKILELKYKIEKLLEKSNDDVNLEELSLKYSVLFRHSTRKSNVSSEFDKGEEIRSLIISESFPNIKMAKEKLNALKGILFDYYQASSNHEEMEKYKIEEIQLENKIEVRNHEISSESERSKEYKKYLDHLKTSLETIVKENQDRTVEDYSFDFDEEDDSQIEKSEKIKKNTEENQESKPTVTEPSQPVSSPTTQQEPTQTATSSSVQTNQEQSSNTNANVNNSSSSEVSAVSSLTSQGVSLPASSSSETDSISSQAQQQVTTEESKELKMVAEPAQPSKTAAQVTDERREVTVELPQPGQAKAAEPVSSPLDDYTKSQINFWIEDFNTSLNKINYSGIYSEYLESLITRGKQLRNKLDKALGENKSSDDIKRDLDQLEMISNTITSVGNARNS